MTAKPPIMIKRAQEMRQAMTDTEMRLWWYLQYNKKIFGKFRRQQVMQNYILDFVGFEHRVVIEVDGGQHTTEKDAPRDKFLQKQGFNVLRFNNLQVLQEIEAVLATILAAIHQRR